MISICECLSGNPKRVAIAGHVRPDGDCAGSVLGLYHYLTENYPEISVTPYLEPLTDNIVFLSEGLPVREDQGQGEFYDLAISLDCSNEERIGAGHTAFEEAKDRICIDHHETNNLYARLNHVEGEASSTCEVLCGLMDMDKISVKTAECLYTGIIHDSGVFRYSCTSPETLRKAALLVEKGVDFSSIILHSITEQSFEEKKAAAVILSESVLLKEESFLYAFASLELQKSLGVTARDLHAVVTDLNEVRGAETVCFVYQLDDGSWKGSLRSKERVDVASIGAVLGGGGHKRAAGFSYSGDPMDAVNEVRKFVKEQG